MNNHFLFCNKIWIMYDCHNDIAIRYIILISDQFIMHNLKPHPLVEEQK